MKSFLFIVCIISFETHSFESFSQTWTYYDTKSGFDNVMSSFIQDHIGLYWIGSVNGGVYRFDGSTFTKTASSGDNEEILAITNIRDTVFAASNNGLIRIVNGSSISKQVITYSTDISKNVFTSIAADSNKVLWIGGGDITGYQLLNYASQKWTAITNNTAGLLHNITCIAVNAKNNIWVCSDGGLSKYNGTTWTNYNTHNSGLATGSLRSVVFDSKSNVWIGVWPGGVCKFDGTHWTTYNSSNSALQNDMINFLAVDKNDNIWAATQNGGVGKFDGTKWTMYNSSNSGLKSDFIQSIAIDKFNRIWIGTMDKGIAVLDNTQTDVKEYEAISTFSIFPNPVNDYVTINGVENQRLGIYSITGIKVIETNINCRIDVSRLQNGMYFVRTDNKLYRFLKY